MSVFSATQAALNSFGDFRELVLRTFICTRDMMFMVEVFG